VDIETVPYGQSVDLAGVRISFHPAGHILGSAQVRIEHRGEVCVVSGDYKLEADPTCTSFEPVRCHTFITESTFALPIYRWGNSADIFQSLNSWWRGNREHGKTSVVYGYALGKSQRLLAGVDASIGPIFTHGAVEKMTQVYRESGMALPPTVAVQEAVHDKKTFAGGLVIAPPSADGSPWARKFEPASTAFASGWMQVRGARRRRALDRGFALSDHADWPALLTAIRESGASRVLVTHGYTAVLARWLREHGIEADTIATRFGDQDEPVPEGQER
jgi:putative mRNA 3-end processing factor